MIINVTGRLWGEDGILIIDDQDSNLVMRSKELPADVVLKVYVTVVRKKKRSGEFQSSKDKMVYEWEVLAPKPMPKTKKQKRGWRAAVFA